MGCLLLVEAVAAVTGSDGIAIFTGRHALDPASRIRILGWFVILIGEGFESRSELTDVQGRSLCFQTDPVVQEAECARLPVIDELGDVAEIVVAVVDKGVAVGDRCCHIVRSTVVEALC